jgi:hypothetical protein
MRRRLLILIGVALAVAGPGCHSCERVENELRAREREARDLKCQLEGEHALNLALQNEVRVSRGEMPAPDGLAPPPVLTSPVKSLTLGRQTGGYDGDGQPGDEALQVVLEPRDCDNQAVKVPAAAEIVAAEILPDGHKRPLSVWQVNSDKLRCSWRGGLLGSGFFVVLPWQAPPTTEKLRVTARLILPDGRSFEADRDVTVKLLPGVKRMPPADGPVVPPRMEPADPLPPEQKPEPPKKAPDGPVLPFPRPDGPAARRKGAGGDAAAWWAVPESARSTATPAERPPTPPPARRPTVEILTPEAPGEGAAPVGAWRP